MKVVIICKNTSSGAVIAEQERASLNSMISMILGRIINTRSEFKWLDTFYHDQVDDKYTRFRFEWHQLVLLITVSLISAPDGKVQYPDSLLGTTLCGFGLVNESLEPNICGPANLVN